MRWGFRTNTSDTTIRGRIESEDEKQNNEDVINNLADTFNNFITHTKLNNQTEVKQSSKE